MFVVHIEGYPETTHDHNIRKNKARMIQKYFRDKSYENHLCKVTITDVTIVWGKQQRLSFMFGTVIKFKNYYIQGFASEFMTKKIVGQIKKYFNLHLSAIEYQHDQHGWVV